MASAFGYCKNTANVIQMVQLSHSVVEKDGRSFLSEVASHTRLNHPMHQLKARPSPWQMPSTVHDTLYLDVKISLSQLTTNHFLASLQHAPLTTSATPSPQPQRKDTTLQFQSDSHCNPTGDPNPPKYPLVDYMDSVSHTPEPSDLISFLRNNAPQQCDIDISLQSSASVSLESLQSITWDRVKVATASDQDLAHLTNMLEYGDMPQTRHEWPESLREYFPFRDHLYTLDGVLMYKERVVIPLTLRDNCIQALHSAHQGTSMMTARAESSVFWPGITKAISNARAGCSY